MFSGTFKGQAVTVIIWAHACLIFKKNLRLQCRLSSRQLQTQTLKSNLACEHNDVTGQETR